MKVFSALLLGLLMVANFDSAHAEIRWRLFSPRGEAETFSTQTTLNALRFDVVSVGEGQYVLLFQETRQNEVKTVGFVVGQITKMGFSTKDLIDTLQDYSTSTDKDLFITGVWSPDVDNVLADVMLTFHPRTPIKSDK